MSRSLSATDLGEIASNIVGVVEFIELDLPTGTLYLTSGNKPYTWGGNTYYPSIMRGGTVSVGTGDGSTASFAEPAGWDSDSKLYVNDWQGNQLQYSTARTNYCTYPNVWNIGNGTPTRTTAAGTAPDGTNTLVKIQAASGQTYAQISSNSSYGYLANQIVTGSFWVQAGTVNYAVLQIDCGSPGGAGYSGAYAYVNASTGAVTQAPASYYGGGAVGPPTNLSCKLVGQNGSAYRFEFTATMPGGASNISLDYQPASLSTGGGNAFTSSAGTEYGYIWGTQIETGNIATSYIPTTTAAVTQTDYSLSGGNIVFANAPAAAAAITAQIPQNTGTPYPVVGNYSETIDDRPRPMSVTISGVDQTLIDNIVGNNIQWVPVKWSMGFIDANNNLLDTPTFTAPMFLGDVTITLSEGKGTIRISCENLLADMQSRFSGMLQTQQDQQQRGVSGNTTFSKDTFYQFAASLMYTWIYWGELGPSRFGVGGGPGPNINQITGGWWQNKGRAF